MQLLGLAMDLYAKVRHEKSTDRCGATNFVSKGKFVMSNMKLCGAARKSLMGRVVAHQAFSCFFRTPMV